MSSTPLAHKGSTRVLEPIKSDLCSSPPAPQRPAGDPGGVGGDPGERREARGPPYRQRHPALRLQRATPCLLTACPFPPTSWGPRRLPVPDSSSVKRDSKQDQPLRECHVDILWQVWHLASVLFLPKAQDDRLVTRETSHQPQ